MMQRWLDDGYSLLRRGLFEDALDVFHSAIELAPRHPQPYFAIAMVYQEQQRYREAMQSLRSALIHDPTYAPARAYLGILLLQDADVEGAQQELVQALHDMPSNLLVHIKYAEFYYRLGMYAQAIAILEKGLQSSHAANEHVVEVARSFIRQAHKKNKNTITRTSPDPSSVLQSIQAYLATVIPIFRRKQLD